MLILVYKLFVLICYGDVNVIQSGKVNILLIGFQVKFRYDFKEYLFWIFMGLKLRCWVGYVVLGYFEQSRIIIFFR